MFPNPSSLIGEGSEIPQAESVVGSRCAYHCKKDRYPMLLAHVKTAFLASFPITGNHIA
jgi:hypothetical protein